MSEQPKSSGVVTTLAVLNIVFGLLCACSGLTTVVGVFIMKPLMATWSAQIQKEMESQRARQLAALEARIAEAGDVEDDEAEAAAIAARDAWLARNPALDLRAFFDGFTQGPMLAYSMADGGLGFLTNLLLLVAGIGLLNRRPWGRTLAIGVAGTKMLVAAIMAGMWFLVVSPALGNTLESFFAEIAKAAPPGQGPPPGMMATQMRLMGILQGGFGLVLASIYPFILLLVLLSRGVRQEFADWEAFRAAGGQ